MLGLISPLRIISIVAVTYAAFVAVALFLTVNFSSGVTLWSSVRVAMSGAFGLDVLLLSAVHFLWRRLWAWFPSLSDILFPDLNGRWAMKIYWNSTEGDGCVDAVAIIKQDFLNISMEVESIGSDSETLMARPKKDSESGRPILYYVYRVVPRRKKSDAGSPYEGAAILKFGADCDQSLSGNYFTSRNTTGHFVLNKIL